MTRRELPEALAWLGGGLLLVAVVGYGGYRAVRWGVRKVKAHNAEVVARREAWRNR